MCYFIAYGFNITFPIFTGAKFAFMLFIRNFEYYKS